MSHNFLFGGGQNRVKHSIPLLCFAEEIDLFHKICGLRTKETKFIHVFISEKRKFAITHCNRTGKTIFLLPQTG